MSPLVIAIIVAIAALAAYNYWNEERGEYHAGIATPEPVNFSIEVKKTFGPDILSKISPSITPYVNKLSKTQLKELSALFTAMRPLVIAKNETHLLARIAQNSAEKNISLDTMFGFTDAVQKAITPTVLVHWLAYVPAPSKLHVTKINNLSPTQLALMKYQVSQSHPPWAFFSEIAKAWNQVAALKFDKKYCVQYLPNSVPDCRSPATVANMLAQLSKGFVPPV